MFTFPFLQTIILNKKKTNIGPGYSFYQFNLNIYIVSILIHRWDFKRKRVLWHFYFLSHLLIHVHFASIPGVRLYIICIYIVGENWWNYNDSSPPVEFKRSRTPKWANCISVSLFAHLSMLGLLSLICAVRQAAMSLGVCFIANRHSPPLCCMQLSWECWLTQELEARLQQVPGFWTAAAPSGKWKVDGRNSAEYCKLFPIFYSLPAKDVQQLSFFYHFHWLWHLCVCSS